MCKAEIALAATKEVQWVPAPQLELDFSTMVNNPALSDSKYAYIIPHLFEYIC